ncbi:hypothetical protein HDU98_003658 [Podochytrium sp. JEL0797]|nr:hypothetical protein HDU98_003658 [Podochytrium sp. JEL0797]
MHGDIFLRQTRCSHNDPGRIRKKRQSFPSGESPLTKYFSGIKKPESLVALSNASPLKKPLLLLPQRAESLPLFKAFAAKSKPASPQKQLPQKLAFTRSLSFPAMRPKTADAKRTPGSTCQDLLEEMAKKFETCLLRSENDLDMLDL